MTAKAATTGKPTPPRGILVIGGGVAGIQAALDLGKAGAKVYLVERTPSPPAQIWNVHSPQSSVLWFKVHTLGILPSH